MLVMASIYLWTIVLVWAPHGVPASIDSVRGAATEVTALASAGCTCFGEFHSSSFQPFDEVVRFRALLAHSLCSFP